MSQIKFKTYASSALEVENPVLIFIILGQIASLSFFGTEVSSILEIARFS